jgi:hypothetical protein
MLSLFFSAYCLLPTAYCLLLNQRIHFMRSR